MAGEIQAQRPTGETLYAILLNEAGAVWNGAAFDATPTTAEWATYDIALTEDNTTGLYRATMPSSTAGDYRYHVHKQLGGTPAPTDPLVWTGELAWNGSAAVGISDAAAGSASAANIASELSGMGFTVVDADSVSTTAISKRRGDVWTITLLDLGAFGTWTKLWFTVKSDPLNDTDANSIIQILLTNPGAGTDGLQRLNAAAATADQGGIVVDDSATGDITVTIAAAASAQVVPGVYSFDVQILRAAGSTTMAEGSFTVRRDVTFAVS